MSDRVIAFFEFKVDRSGLRYGVVQVVPQTLGAIAAFSSMGYWFFEESNAKTIYELLDGKIWIGHDIGSDVSRLVKAFAEFGIDHPTPKSIYDTRILLLSDTKFAKLAVHFGLGNEVCTLGYGGCYGDDVLHQNINAIKQCEDVMSFYEPDKLKKYVGRDFHPMISYLMDVPTADVTELFREAICESAKERAEALLIKENANTKRKVSGVIDTTGIPEVTCQTENDIEKGVVSLETNQIVDNIVTKKTIFDDTTPVKGSVHSKRQCVRSKSLRFDVQETEQTEKLLEMDDAKEIKETARRRSARLLLKEASMREKKSGRRSRGEVLNDPE